MSFHPTRVALSVSALVAVSAVTGHAAATYTYDFGALAAGTVPAVNQSPAPAGVSYQGTTTVGQIGQDNWVWTSSAANFFSSIARNDTTTGMSGTYVSAYPTVATSATGTAPPSYDTINSRKNTASGFNYAIPQGASFRVSFVANITGTTYTTAASQTNSSSSRAEVALGYDQNNDGDIRGDAANAENAEWGPLFGYESASSSTSTTAGLTGKWYVRPAALGTAVTVNANGPGTYMITLDVNPNTNFNAHAADGATYFAGNDGSGTLSVQQLADANGAAVNDTLHNIAGLVDVNLGLTRMTQHNSTNVGTANGWNPAYWDGLITRLANNGTMDNLSITITPEPTTLALAAGAGLLLGRRRRA